MQRSITDLDPGSVGLQTCAAASETLSRSRILLPPRVVLLEPKRGANVGAVCRAIKNMGAAGLVLVGGEFDSAEAERTSVHARDVFASRLEVPTFEEAIAGCSLVIGTTSRTTPWRVPVVPIRQVAREAISAARRAPADDDAGAVSPLAPQGQHVPAQSPRPCALVFGREDRGLSNEELSRCHRLAYIPTADEYASLNLAQAAVVCLYEWFVAGQEEEAQTQAPIGSEQPQPLPMAAGKQAEAASVSAALDDLRGVLIDIGFLSAEQPDRVMAAIASLLTRSGVDEREVRIVRGIVRQMRWFVSGGAEVAELKRAAGRKLR